MAAAETIQSCLDLFESPSYLEIGVATGGLFHALQAGRKVAVDPNFEFDLTTAKASNPHAEYYQIPSDKFFSEYKGEPFDVVYIDGLHTAEQSLRDLLNSIAFVRPNSIIVIDDVFPNSYAASLASWDDAWVVKSALSPNDWDWMGDVYKLIYFIETFLQQYTFASPIGEHAQLVLWRQTRDQVPDRTIAQVGKVDFFTLYRDRALLREAPLMDIIEATKVASGASKPQLTVGPRAPMVRVKQTIEPATLYDRDPPIEIHRDCVYVPIIQPVNFWENPYWGIYDRNGQLIDAAAFRDMPEMGLSGQSPICIADIADAPYAPLDRYFYTGNMINHYGHFLCSSMCRLWALTHGDNVSLPLIAHGVGTPDDWFGWPFARTLFGAAGVVREDFAHFDRPVRIRELVVAGPSFVERNLVHAVHARAAHVWGDCLTKTQNVSDKLDMVYLSKMKWGAHPAGYSNEAPLVSVLEQAGVPIVYPEDLSIPEQVALFKRTRLIIGQGGSQFHTTILAQPPPDQILIQLVWDQQRYTTNHGLMDLANGNRAMYLYFKGEWHQHPDGPPQLRLADPKGAARELLDFARSL